MNEITFTVVKQAVKANRTTLASVLDTLRNIKNDGSFEDSLKSVLYDLDNTQTNINQLLSFYYLGTDSDKCDEGVAITKPEPLMKKE